MASQGNQARRGISVVIPVKNEENGLAPLFARLLPALAALPEAFEIVMVDDGSSDATFARLEALRQTVPTLRIVKLSRNFGKEIAVYAGFARASGDAVVLMDADLQHPPESIDALLRPWREGRAKVVHARRIAFDRGSTGREVLTRLFYRLFKRFSNIEIDPEAGDFIVVDRAVVEAFRAMPERHRFNRGLIAWAGFPSARVDVATESRHVGTSQWGTVRLFKLAVTALMSFGTLPLRVWSYIGTAVALLSLVYGAFILLRTLVFGGDVPGYPSIFVAVSFLAGVQLISLGIIGQYLGHVYAEVKRRPLYFEERLVGFEDDTGGRP